MEKLVLVKVLIEGEVINIEVDKNLQNVDYSSIVEEATKGVIDDVVADAQNDPSIQEGLVFPVEGEEVDSTIGVLDELFDVANKALPSDVLDYIAKTYGFIVKLMPMSEFDKMIGEGEEKDMNINMEKLIEEVADEMKETEEAIQAGIKFIPASIRRVLEADEDEAYDILMEELQAKADFFAKFNNTKMVEAIKGKMATIKTTIDKNTPKVKGLLKAVCSYIVATVKLTLKLVKAIGVSLVTYVVATMRSLKKDNTVKGEFASATKTVKQEFAFATDVVTKVSSYTKGLFSQAETVK